MGKKIKIKEYTAMEKSVALMAALGFLINSITASGTNITPDKDFGTTVNKNDNVYNIFAGQVHGNNAFNKFNNFELDANNIANMYFGKDQNGNADNLFNFVDTQIKVNGVVNAIKNNKIDGNLFFLSSSGMVVGSTGTINTGSLYVLTPSKDEYVRLADAGKTEHFDVSEVMSGQIPLNPEGTITVEGTIKATDKIAMYAGQSVNIGNENTDPNVVILETGVKFGNLVNIEKTGLVEESGRLTAKEVADGSIVLVARADAENTADELFNKELGSIVQVDNFVSRDIKAEVNINGSVKAAGDLTVKAEAYNGSLLGEDETTGEKLYNSNPLVSTTASVNINKGTVEGKNVDIDAVTENKYLELATSEEGSEGGGSSSGGAMASAGILTNLLKINGSVGALKGDAQVNIGKDAVVNAGEQMDINAQNNVSLTLGATTSTKKSTLSKIKDAVGNSKPGVKSYLPAAGAVIGYTEGNASVNVEGKLTSGKDMNIKAFSSNEMDLNATAIATDDTKVVVALGIGVGNNNASVNLEGADLSAGENLNINSEVENSLTSITESTTGNKNLVSTSLNLVAYDSSSKINIKDSNIEALNGDINIDSKNTVLENKIISDNNAGKKKSFLKKYLKEELTAIKDLEEVNKLLTNVKDKVGLSGEKTEGDGAKQEKKKGIAEKITAGAAMAFVGEENTSNINIQGSNITGKNVNINSVTKVVDTLMSVSGDTVSSGKESLIIGAGVLYGQMGNTSSIVIDGEDSDTSSVITASDGNIQIKSLTEMKYDRVGQMVDDLKESIKALEKSLDDLKDYFTAENLEQLYGELKTGLSDLGEEVETFGANAGVIELDSLFSEEGVFRSYNMIKQAQGISEQLTALTENLTPDVAAVVSALSDSITNLANFANVGNYGNFSVRTTARDTEGKSVAVAGSVSITNLQNDSKVVIGKNTNLTATKDISIKSENNTEAVNVGGNIGQLIIKANGGQSEEGTAIGGSFIMQDFDVNSIVAIAEGAKIKGSNINIGADSDIFNVNAVLSAGKSAGTAINGMVSYSTGSINNLVSIDDEVLLETTSEEADSNKINIEANAETNITNVAGGMSSGGNVGVGVGVAINEFDVNNKVEIKDNDNNKELADLVKHEHKNKVLDVIKGASIGDLVFDDDNEDKENQNQNIGLFDGSSLEVGESDKGVTARELNANAKTSGMINSVSAAGALSSRKEGEEEKEEEKEGMLDSLKNNLSEKVGELNNGINELVGKFNNNGAVSEFMGKGENLNEPQGESQEDITNKLDTDSNMSGPTINIAGAGSASVNLIDNVTATEIDGIKITMKGDNNSVNVSAKDESFTGAWSGAASINWISKKGSGEQKPSQGTSAALHGAVGINIVERDTSAVIRNSEIVNAEAINAEAVNDSVTVAAGLGLSVVKSDNAAGNKSYQGGASVSLNDIEHKTSAYLENVDSYSETEKETDIKVNALESGIQVTGGVDINVGKSNGAAGAAVTVALINNTIEAGIKGGNLQNIRNVDVDGTLDITQVTAAAGIGATSSSGGNSSAFQGAVTYNGTNNTVNSVIDSADIDASGNINVTAGDGRTDAKEHQYKSTLEGLGIDTTGKGYYSGIDTNLSSDSDSRKNIENNKKGSTIITASATVAGASTNALGAGVAVSNIKNNFSAEIKGTKDNTIKADTVNVSSSADTFIVGAAGGVAVGKDTFGGMGSVSWQELENSVSSKISGVSVTANEINVTSSNTAFEVNAGGQVSYGGSAGVGAVLAYTNIDNTTSASIENADITLVKDEAAENPENPETQETVSEAERDKAVNVSASSSVENYTVGAGVTASKEASVAGTVAVVQGGNTTSAKIEGTTIKNVDTVNTLAQDKNNVYTIVGTVTGSAGTAAVGGAGAYSELDKNSVLAAINNSNITTNADSDINVGALDTSKNYTIAAGVGGAGKVAVEGAAAVSTITKSAKAVVSNTNINSEEDEEERSTNLNVSAESKGEIISNASVIIGAGTAGIGAGTAVNIIKQNTEAEISGGIQNSIKDAQAKAKSLASITTIGIGGSGAGTAAITGSVAANLLTNNTTSSINGAVMNADGSIGIVAESDDVISNYAGTVSGAGTAAIGASVSYNEVNGNTTASAENAKLTAGGNGDGITTNSNITNDAIIDSVIKEETAQLGNNLDGKRNEETKNGIVIDSSSTHTVKSLLANAGLAGTVAVNGTVNINKIGGTTNAGVGANSVLNAGNSNVNVKAGDYTNSSGIVGSASISGNASIGAAADTNLVSRAVLTSVKNSQLAGNNIDIQAVAKQGISSFGIGAAVGVSGAGVAGTVAVTDLEGKTAVEIENAEITAANNVDITSDHYDKVSVASGSLGGAAVGVGAGAGVSVTKDESETTIDITNGNITAENKVDIMAQNDSRLSSNMVAAGIAGLGAGVSGTVSINNIESVVSANISGGSIKSNAGDIEINSLDQTSVELLAAGAAGGGIAGVGATVTVNTFDSASLVNISGAEITAEKGKIDVKAEDERNAEQMIINTSAGIVAVGGNVIINNFGTAVGNEDIYNDDDGHRTINDVYNDTNNKYQGTKFDNKTTGVLGSYGITEEGTKVEAGKGGNGEGVNVNILNGSKLTAENIDVNAVESDDVNVVGGTGSLGGVSASGTVALTDIERKVGVNIRDSYLTAKENEEIKDIIGRINIGTDIRGNAALEVYQGSAGLVSVNAAYGEINTKGDSVVNISHANISGKDINISAKDTASVSNQAIGLTGGLIAAGAIVAESENTSNLEINISDSTISAENSNNISTEKTGEVEVEAMGGSVGVVSGLGVDATAKDNSTSAIKVQGSNNRLQGKDLIISAINSPRVRAEAGSLAVGALSGVGVSFSEASSNAKASLIIDSGNTLVGDEIYLGAGIIKNTLEAKTVANGGGLGVGIAVNEAKTENNTEVTVDLGNQNYLDTSEQENSNVTVSALNNSKLKVTADGLNIGGIVAVGVNQATSISNGKTEVKMTGGNVNGMEINAGTTTDVESYVNGDGGGLIAVDGNASAILKNQINNSTNVNISGKWNVKDYMQINAKETDVLNLAATSTKVGAVTVAGISVTNEIGDKDGKGTEINFAEGTEIKGSGSVRAEAENQIDLNKSTLRETGSSDKNKYENVVPLIAEGGTYGAVGVQLLNVDNDINKTAEINIGRNTAIKTDKEQVYNAETTGEMNLRADGEAAGAGAGTKVLIDNDMTFNNNVNVAENVNLTTNKADQDITLAANDIIQVRVSTITKADGAVGVATAESQNDLTRNNKINIAKNDMIHSMNSINLYAGKNASGQESNLTLKVSAEAFSDALVAVPVPDIYNTVNQNNQLVISGNSTVESVRNINLEANSGTNKIEEAHQKYAWHTDETKSDYTTTESGKANSKVNSNNYVQADGNLRAGIYANQDITIDGIFNTDDTIEVTDNVAEGNVTGTLNGKDVTAQDLEIKTENLTNTLIERYNELEKLIAENSEANNSVGEGYRAEKNALLVQMLETGVATKDKKGVITPTKNVSVNYVELPDIVASGGNITIKADNFIGNGELNATGGPKVTIQNYSNLYIKVGDIKIGEVGGKITFNDKDIASGTIEGKNEQIRNINLKDDYKGSRVGLKGIEVSEQNTGTPEINILNDGITSFNIKTTLYDEDGKELEVKTGTVDVVSTIEINGNVENTLGNINIENKTGSILQQSRGEGESSSIIGLNVSMKATGSIIQGSSEGMITLADEQSRWKNEQETLQNSLFNSYDKTNSTTTPIKEDSNKNNDESGNTNYYAQNNKIAGGAIVLSATDINVNGLIQSGVKDYKVELGKDAENKIAKFDQEWSNNPGSSVSLTDIKRNYKLNDGGFKYDSENGIMYYEVQTYYNPATKEVIVEDINPTGGQIYLTGRIMSTGNGKIVALDGAADINITNNVNNNDISLKLGNISNGDSSGFISITDTTKTETVNGQNRYVTTEYGTIDGNGETRYNYTYNPTEGLRYNWTNGTKSATTKTYTWSQYFSWWGLRESKSKTELSGLSDKHPEKEVNVTGGQKEQGYYIDIDTGNKADFTVSFENHVSSGAPTVSDPRVWTEYKNWTHWSGTDYYEWDETVGTTQTYKNSLRADKPIEIEFITSSNGGKINIDSNATVVLGGNLKNSSDGKGSVSINTDNSITRTGGSIYSNNVTLNAETGDISNIKITSVGDNNNNINLSANAMGDISIEAAKNVIIGSMSGDYINLSASGDITQTGTSASIVGNRIDLASTDGGINLKLDTANELVNIQDSLSTSINASAKKDINIEEVSGDMRIGKIESTDGDITLTTQGDILDALPDPNSESTDRASVEEMIENWQSAGLIEGSQEYLDKKKAEADDYKAGVEYEYNNYQSLKDYYKKLSEETGDIDKTKDSTYEIYQQMAAKYGDKSLDEYLAKDESYQELLKNPEFKWTKEKLLYAIKSSIANPEEGSTTDPQSKEANIVGRNITLNVGGGVGKDAGTEVIDLTTLADNNYANMKKLASSEAADVKWGMGLNELGEEVKDETKAIVSNKKAIGIKLADSSGKLSIDANDNVYLAVRNNAGDVGYTEINVDHITTNQDKDIRIFGIGGVFNAADAGKVNFTGKDLIIEGGSADLGATDKALTTDLKGTLTARTNENIYIDQIGSHNMQIAAIYAGEDVVLKSANDIVSVAGELGYINSVAGDIVLEAVGNIGNGDGGALRIKNNVLDVNVINATAGGNIYLDGKNSGADADTGTGSENVKTENTEKEVIPEDAGKGLTLGQITGNGTISVAVKEENIKANGNIINKSDSGETILEAKNNITLEGKNSENVSEIRTNSLVMNAGNGNITQENNNIFADVVKAAANNGIELDSTGNNIRDLEITNNINDILINNNGDLALNITKENIGNVNIVNKAGDVIVNSDITANGENSTVNIENTGAINFGENSITANSDVALSSTETGAITVKDITSGGTTIAETQVGDIKLTTVTSTGDVKVSSTESGAITAGTIKTEGATTVETKVGDIKLTTVTSTGDVKVSSTEEGAVTAGTITTDDGTTTVGTQVGDIELTTVTSTGDVKVSSTEEGVVTAGTIKTDGATTVETKVGNIELAELDSSGNVNISAKEEGSITSTGHLKSINESMKLYTAKGDVNLVEMFANKEADVETDNGDVIITKEINGDKVIITLGNKGNKIDVAKIVVGTGGIISSNDITLSDLNQRENSHTPVDMTLNNSKDNTDNPIDDVVLYATKLKYGLRLNKDGLWVRNAEISTDGAVLEIPKLVVTGRGHFSNATTKTTVYGADGEYDNSDVSIWNDASAKEWITLNFTGEPNTIESTGKLLKVNDGFKVYGERESGEEIMIQKLDDFTRTLETAHILENPFEYAYKPYLNYNLIDSKVDFDVDTFDVVEISDNKIIIKTKQETIEEVPVITIKDTDKQEEEKIAQK